MNMYRILLVLALLVSGNLNASINYNEPISIDSRIKTFVYSPNEVFTVVFSQGYYSYIEFAEGEKLKISLLVMHQVGKLILMTINCLSCHLKLVVAPT